MKKLIYSKEDLDLILALEEEEKDKEIERLNNDIKILLKENENKEKVILKYDNIINETKEYLEYQISQLDFYEDTKAKMLGSMAIILLKGDDKE